ncbi:hypothetical protein [Paenibacillus sonchi]|uniref:hypothetical protein n=1 Tax=Paenibacillus sonchi TaxID=373687 RepID=UPI00031B1395|nr:hypothetical protein [Paenibacillus sonchi]
MEYVIKNNIELEQIKLLKSIEGASSLRLYIEEVGEFALNLFIESHDRTICIKNIPNIASDGDDYPKLIIEYVMTPSSDCELLYEGNDFESILILKDAITWEGDDISWKVEVDIGIKIVFQQEQFLLLAQDSLAGLLKVFRLSTVPVEEVLESYWSMKTDKIDSLIRKEMRV